ncbi:MAG TPA: hypothetical protein VM345_01805 [Acidimicrobiales bacterium]|nr:hypothetical protein [Acidimicrobiales bacterium]
MTATADAIWTEMAVRLEPKRDRYGRYLIEGKPYTRVTTFAETIDDRYNLERWKQRMTAVGIAARPDLYAQVASTPVADKSTLNKLCDQAVEAAKGSAGANLGTALHRFTERIDSGEPINVPAPWNADIDAYQQTMNAAGVEVQREFIERVVVIDQLELAGTFDRLVRLPGHPLPLIADLKTGATLDYSWGAIAIQLACYANASRLYDIASDSTDAMVDVDRERALVIHLPAGTANCVLYEVDIAAGWTAAQLCADVRAWRKRKNLASPLAAAPASALADPADLERFRTRVRAIIEFSEEAGATLARSWPKSVPTLREGGHTTAHLEALNTICTKVEAHFLIPDPFMTAARKAASRLRSEGFDVALVEQLRKAHTPEEFALIAGDLVEGRSCLQFTEDGAPVVAPFPTSESETKQ